jgi:hypothetical protein
VDQVIGREKGRGAVREPGGPTANPVLGTSSELLPCPAFSVTLSRGWGQTKLTIRKFVDTVLLYRLSSEFIQLCPVEVTPPGDNSSVALGG